MALISLTLDQNEESMVDFLSKYYERDTSSLIKYSIQELYEDIIDRRVITEFEAKKKRGEVKFVDSDDVMNALQNMRN